MWRDHFKCHNFTFPLIVTTITINRPHARNALDREASLELAAAIRAFEADDAAQVAVLTEVAEPLA